MFSIFAQVNLRKSLVFILLLSTGLIPCLGFVRSSYARRILRAKPTTSQQLQTPSHKRGEVLVRFKGGTPENDKNIVAGTYGVHRKKQLRGESSIEKFDVLSSDDAAAVAAQMSLNPQVEFAEPNFIINKTQVETTPNDPRFSEQWAIKNTGQNDGQYGSDIGVVSIWGQTTGAQSVTIAVVDSGIDFTHPDLANNEWTNLSPTNDDLHGWDYVADTAEVKDLYGHGMPLPALSQPRETTVRA